MIVYNLSHLALIYKFLSEMLYQSLKVSILEYTRKKQKSQTEQQKSLFRWKIITLGFCILAIVLMGILTQLFKQIEDDEVLKYNTTFLPELLQDSQQLKTISDVKSLLTGLNASKRVKYAHVEHLLNSSEVQVSSVELLNKINQKEGILYLWSLESIEDEIDQNYRFGMFLKRQFDYSLDDEKGMINVDDPDEDRSSVVFNLQNSLAQRMNLAGGCHLYRYNETDKSVVLMESIRMQAEDQYEVELGLVNWRCFGATEIQALEKFNEVVGVNFTDVDQSEFYSVNRLEIYQLLQNGQDNEL